MEFFRKRTCIRADAAFGALLLSVSISSAQSARSLESGAAARAFIASYSTDSAPSDGIEPGRIRALEAAIPADTLEIAEGEDGVRYTAIRYRSDDAAGLRLHFTRFAIPEGGRVFVYSLDRVGGQKVFGPFEGSGPLSSGDFWTPVLAGPEAVVEYQFGDSPFAGIPFHVSELAHLDADLTSEASLGDAGFAGPEFTRAQPSSGVFRTSRFRGMTVTHEVRDGQAILETDILLGPADSLEPASDKDDRNDSIIATSTAFRWPNGVVPYVIDASLANQSRVTAAIAHWNQNLAGAITMVPRTTQANYIRFTDPGNAGVCNSYIGMIGGVQPINLGSLCSTGNAIHEIGHALGLFHEQSRNDRDTFVRIVTSNIDPAMMVNFQKAGASGRDTGAYDYNSIMHYPSTAFSINGQPTIQTIPAGIPIGQRNALSTGDIASIRANYGGAAPPVAGNVVLTFRTNPAGLTLQVNGSTLTTPASITVRAGTAVSVSAPTITQSNARFTFASWADGGAMARTLTAPATAATYTANFSVEYQITAFASPAALGQVSLTPVSAHGFYAANATLGISAAPANSACFAGWTGLTPPNVPNAQFQATGSGTIIGRFQSGTVALSAATLSVLTAGGNSTVRITATPGCVWTALSAAPWITFSGAASGSGSGQITLVAARNSTGVARSATVQVGGRTIAITQAR